MSDPVRPYDTISDVYVGVDTSYKNTSSNTVVLIPGPSVVRTITHHLEAYYWDTGFLQYETVDQYARSNSGSPNLLFRSYGRYPVMKNDYSERFDRFVDFNVETYVRVAQTPLNVRVTRFVQDAQTRVWVNDVDTLGIPL